MFLFSLLLVIAFVVTPLPTATSIELPCPLKWRLFSAGDFLPPSTVTLGQDRYIARVYNPASSRHDLGTGDSLSGVALIKDQFYTSYEVLTNPEGCDLDWVSGAGPFGPIIPLRAWPMGKASNSTKGGSYVGRVLVGASYFAGTVDPSKGFISKVPYDLFQKSGLYKPCDYKNYEVLRSTSPGLHFEVQDLSPEAKGNLPYFSSDYMGKDEIRNDADVELVHIVRHTKKITQVKDNLRLYGDFFTIVGSAKLGGSILPPILKIEFEIFWKKATQRSTGKLKKTQREVTIEREIRVPPLQSVQVCSAVELRKKLNEQFKAKGLITGRGMSGAEIYQVLKTVDPEFEGEVLDHAVRATVKAKVTSKKAAATRLLVYPLDAMKGCTVLQRAAAQDTMTDMEEMKEVEEAWRQEAEADLEHAKQFKDRLSNLESFQLDEGVESQFPGVAATRQQMSLLKSIMRAKDGLDN